MEGYLYALNNPPDTTWGMRSFDLETLRRCPHAPGSHVASLLKGTGLGFLGFRVTVGEGSNTQGPKEWNGGALSIIICNEAFDWVEAR